MCRLVGAAMLSLAVASCASHERPQPHTRFGALPFPGVTSLFHAADAGDLGEHHYSGWADRPFESEGERGILYTERAGFVDIVHLRNAADWTWYAFASIQDARTKAARNGTPGPQPLVFDFEGARVRVLVPETPDNDAALAAHVSYAVLTWHEAATWYGHSMVALVSEKRSAFTCDDVMSHILGVRAAEEVIDAGATEQTYDTQMTAQIGADITSLEPRTPAGTLDACTDARGAWWEGNSPILRDAAVHLDGSPKRPLLLTTTGGARQGDLEFSLPAFTAPVPADWITIEVQPVTRERVKAVLGSTTIRGVADLDRVVDDVAVDLAAKARTVVLRQGDAAVPALPTRHAAIGSSGPVVAQFIAPARPSTARVESEGDVGSLPVKK